MLTGPIGRPIVRRSTRRNDGLKESLQGYLLADSEDKSEENDQKVAGQEENSSRRKQTPAREPRTSFTGLTTSGHRVSTTERGLGFCTEMSEQAVLPEKKKKCRNTRCLLLC